MKKFNYSTPYKAFKSLPLIEAGVVLLASLVLGIIDTVDCFTEIGYSMGGAAFIVWLLIGAAAAAIVFWSTAIFISPTVLRTDAAIESAETLSKLSNTSSSKAKENIEDELPEI